MRSQGAPQGAMAGTMPPVYMSDASHWVLSPDPTNHGEVLFLQSGDIHLPDPIPLDSFCENANPSVISRMSSESDDDSQRPRGPVSGLLGEATSFVVTVNVDSGHLAFSQTKNVAEVLATLSATLRDPPTAPHPSGGGPRASEAPKVVAGFLWVNLLKADIPDMGALSDALGLHPLTVKEIIGGDDAEDKSLQRLERLQLFPSQGYLYCNVNSQGADGRPYRINILLFPNALLTIHDVKAPPIVHTWNLLQKEFMGQASGVPTDEDVSQESKRCFIGGSPSWLLLGLLDVDWMVPQCEALLANHQENLQLCFDTPVWEQGAALQGISTARATLYDLQQRVVSKERLLNGLLAPSTAPFIPGPVKVGLRSLQDVTAWCREQLNAGDQALGRLTKNFLLHIRLEGARLTGNSRPIIRRLTVIVSVPVALHSVLELSKMGFLVPFQDVESYWPFAMYASACVCVYAAVIFGNYLYEMDRKKKHLL